MATRELSKIRMSILFILFTFIITYSCWITLALNKNFEYGTPLFMTLYMIGGFGPTFAAFIMLLLNRSITKDYFKRLLKWKVNPIIYLIISLTVIVMCVALITIYSSKSYSLQKWYLIFPIFITMIIGGGLEELGWRGILLDSLMDMKWSIIVSSLFIGIIWAFWHFPLFYIEGVSQFQGNFWLFFVNVIGLSLITTILYHGSKSILICVLFHALVNSTYSMGFDVSNSDLNGLAVKNVIPVVIGIILMTSYLAVIKVKERKIYNKKFT